MSIFEKIEKDINELKEMNQEAGNLLHDQLHYASNASWSKNDLSDSIKSEEDAIDLLDKDLLSFEEQQEKARNIQDAIIQSFSE